MENLSTIVTYIGQGLILMGLLFTGFGVYAVLRLDGFYARSVITSKVESMGFVTVVIGAMLVSGWAMTIPKLLILLLFELLTVSASTHAIARSAWLSGYRSREVIALDVDEIVEGEDG